MAPAAGPAQGQGQPRLAVLEHLSWGLQGGDGHRLVGEGGQLWGTEGALRGELLLDLVLVHFHLIHTIPELRSYGEMCFPLI